MYEHTGTDTESLQRGVEDIKRSLISGEVGGPYEFSADLTFEDVVSVDDPVITTRDQVINRYKRALQRDSIYKTSSYQWQMAFGGTQAMREVYELGRELANVGA